VRGLFLFVQVSEFRGLAERRIWLGTCAFGPIASKTIGDRLPPQLEICHGSPCPKPQDALRRL